MTRWKATPSVHPVLLPLCVSLALACGTNTKGPTSSGATSDELPAPDPDDHTPSPDGPEPDEAGDTEGDTGTPDEDGDGGDDGTYTPDDDTEDSTRADADGDGLSDAIEEYICSDLDHVDSDGDGLWDGEEIYEYGTDPLCADTDGDGIKDAHEVSTVGSDPLDPNDPSPTAEPEPECEEGCDGSSADLAVDHDGDSLTLLEELECGSDDFSRGAGHDPADSDGDGLGDAEECASDCLESWNPDTDGDSLMDGMEVGLGTEACNADTDADGRTDGEELLVSPLSDPTLADTDGDGLNDGDELTSGCDPSQTDTDGDGLSDRDEVTAGTDCDNEDTDGDGMKDATELSTVGGKTATDPLDPSDAPAFIDPEAGDVWTCSVMTTTNVTNASTVPAGYDALTFPDDSAYYGSYSRTNVGGAWISTSTECACDDILVAATGPLDIAGVTVWAEDAVHAVDYSSGGTSYTSRHTQANWATKSVPAGVAFLQGSSSTASGTSWLAGAQALYSATDTIVDEHAMSGSDPVWAAFYESPATPDGTSATATDPTGLVNLRVSRMTPEDSTGYPQPISDCLELQWDGSLGNGLQFRVDLVSPYAVRPPGYTTTDAPEHCRPGEGGQTRFGLLSLSGQAPRPLPIRGSTRYAHARATHVRVARWNGAGELQLTHPSGARLTLTPTESMVALPGDGWLLTDTRFDVGRSAPGLADPVIEVQHACTGMDTPDAGPVEVPGYTLSYARVEAILEPLGLAGGLQALWPELSEASRSPLRLRLELPERFPEGPDRAWLRLDVAGVGTLYKVPMSPDLAPALRAYTSPAEVTRWKLHSRNDARTIGGSIEQTPTGLQVVLHTLAIGDVSGESARLASPLVFTLPAE